MGRVREGGHRRAVCESDDANRAAVLGRSAFVTRLMHPPPGPLAPCFYRLGMKSKAIITPTAATTPPVSMARRATDARVAGNLTKVECVGRQIRLVVEGEDHKLTRLLMRDPSSVPIQGGGEQKLGCGAQQPRQVVVEYFVKRDAKAATAGEVAMIQFQE